jgi:transcription initiation factor TFIIIB Brf1 subunit/transcription initiation factor TFIIB
MVRLRCCFVSLDIRSIFQNVLSCFMFTCSSFIASNHVFFIVDVRMLQDKATQLYRDAHLRGMARQGGSYSGGKALVAASIYMACQQSGCPRSLKEISLLSGTPMKQIRRMSAKVFSSTVQNNDATMNDSTEGKRKSISDGNIEGGQESESTNANSKRQRTETLNNDGGSSGAINQVKPTLRIVPSDLINRIGSHFTLSSQMMEVAKIACEKIRLLSLDASQPPQCIAAAVIVYVSLVIDRDIDLNSLAIVAACSISNVTKACSLLRPYVKSIFPKDFILSHDKGVKSLHKRLETLCEA